MSTKNGWIDFRALCKSVGIAKVLELYNIQLKVKGDQAQGFCPLPDHNGQKRSPSFSVNLVKNCWRCFGCSAQGNLLDLVARLEGLDPFKGKDVRKAALLLQDKLRLTESTPPKKDRGHEDSRAGNSPSNSRSNLPVIVNAPLDFELKNLNPEHPYLLGRGFRPETIQQFGLGYCNKGMLKERIAIPIHDPAGMLVGYGGRVVDDRAINAENPKYRLPTARERNGKLHEFHKSELLYNAHRIKKKVDSLIIVESFPSVWWLHQHGYTDVVALMGSDCSDEQAKLILERVEFDGRIWLMTDGDQAGERCARTLFDKLARYRFIKWIELKQDEQPTDSKAEDLDAILRV
jgi:DNA primase